MFKSGDKVAEHLELVRLLGAGGMGSVWVAKHLRLRSQVAVKLLSAGMLNNPAARSRFDREAQWVAQVKSPHVVQVLDQGVTNADPPQPYIVMELLEGEDLGRLLERVGSLPLPEAAHILDQVCSGLAAAHTAGLVHRDIKPENIFLMSGDRSFVKLLDFGIARATQDAEQGRLTQTGGVIGTAHYMSPEQLFEGKQVDHRSDVWALGVVTYRMLTGRLPFDGNTYGDLCLAVNQGVFTPASSVAALPPELDLFLARALATNRNQRFASVKEFAAEFTAFVQRQSGMSNLPVLPGSASGAVAPTIGSRPATSGTQQLQTEAVASVTLQDVPMRRSGPALMGAILGVVLIGAVAVAAFKVWSSGGVMEADPPAKGNHTVAARAAASSLLPPAAGAKTPHKSSASEVDASNLEADVKASDLSGARDVKVEPAGVEPAGKQRQAPLAPAKQAISRRAVGTPATPSKLAKSPSTHHASAPESSGTKPSPPSVPQEKYRGF